MTLKKIFFLTQIFIFAYSALFSQSPEDYVIKIAKFKGNKSAAISYTFDDGYREHYTLVASELEKRGFRGTFWVNGTTQNRNEPEITDTTRATWMQLKEMTQKGHEISNHGWSHKNLNRITNEEVIAEIRKNDSIILEKTGVMPVTYCYAYNAKNDDAVKLASVGRVGTRTFQRSIGSKATDENLKKWVDELIGNKDWGVGMTHGISYGYDAFSNPQVFWLHLDQVKSLEDKIWVGTFREVSAYVTERDSTRLKIVKKKNKLKISLFHSLNRKLFNQPLTLIVNTSERALKSVKQGTSEIIFRQTSPSEIVFDFDPSGKQIIIRYAAK